MHVCPQPVHNTGSTGYSSVTSNDLHISMSSPGESVGHKVHPEAEGECSKTKPVSGPPSPQPWGLEQHCRPAYTGP